MMTDAQHTSILGSRARPLVLLVEDEEHLAEGVLFNLREEGFRTHHEADGDAALQWIIENHAAVSAVLLDVMLPGRDGFAIVRAMREAGLHTPVLMLTARGRSEDVVQGFEAGADDYVTKPFSLSVLLARLTSLLRRVRWQQDASPAADAAPPAASAALRLGAVEVDFAELVVRRGDSITHLTVMEADLLRYLADRAGKVVSRKELLENVWRVRDDTDTRAVDNFIVRLRRYIEPSPGAPVFLTTVRGVGYRFVLPAAE